MGCNSSSAVEMVLTQGPPDGAESEEVPAEDARLRAAQAAMLNGHSNRVMDEFGVFYGAPSFPDQGLTLAEILLQSLRTFAAEDRIAQIDVDTDEPWTFGTLLAESVQVADALARQGLGTGDVVAFFSRNYHQLYSAVVATLYVGATVAAMVPNQTAGELRHQLILAKPRILFSEPALIPRARDALAGLPLPAKLISLLDPGPDDGLPSYAGLLEEGANADPDSYTPAIIADRSANVAFILYSSGTTGMPKGVMLTNRALVTHLGNLEIIGQGTDSLSMLVLSPISWISGVWMLLNGIQMGVTRVFIPELAEAKIFMAIPKYQISRWMTAPSAIAALCSNPTLVSRLDLSPLQAVLCGGGPLGADLQKQAEQLFRCIVVQAYGCTEAGLVFSTDPRNRAYGSMGVVQRGVSVRLVDLDTGEVVMEPHGVGEMRVKTPCIMKGYVGNPQETAAVFDDEGWYRSGDLVYFDEDGNFFYVDRLKEMMKYQSYQVAPSEVEAVIVTHPGVKDVAVVGRPHPLDGEHPAAFVVRSAGHEELEEQEIQDYVAERLSDPKKLRGGVIFVEVIPRTLTGKAIRPQLKNMLKTMPPPLEEETA